MICMEAGWVVSEVGRQPWIVYNQMKVEDAATGNTGVWITFVLVAVLYVGLGVTTVLILRKMSRRFRERDVQPTTTCRTARGNRRREARRDEVTVPMSTAVAVLLFVAVTAYADLRRRRLRRRVLGPRRRRCASAASVPAR